MKTNTGEPVQLFSEFLAKNSGSSNAYTDQLETNYFF